MPSKELLLQRLDEIAASLAASGHGLALIGLGSVGRELERLDEFSDLDFFAIVENGWKIPFLRNLDWLTTIHPVTFSFKNTPDGYKLLYDDGVFCEFAVFELGELARIPYSPGRIVWKQAHVPDEIAEPRETTGARYTHQIDWALGEALTNIYVGLCRYRRGEKLVAQRFIQHYAVDRVVELAPHVEAPQPGDADPFSSERRFEQRFPKTAAALPAMVLGYERSPESARAILDWLCRHFPVDTNLREAILDLC